MEKVKTQNLIRLYEQLPAPQVQWSASCRYCAKPMRCTALSAGYPADPESSRGAAVRAAERPKKQIYRFTKATATPRPCDSTLTRTLAVHFVAQHYGELTFPFRRFQIGKVYCGGERAARPFPRVLSGDIDVIGDGKLDIINEAGAEHHLI